MTPRYLIATSCRISLFSFLLLSLCPYNLQQTIVDDSSQAKDFLRRHSSILIRSLISSSSHIVTVIITIIIILIILTAITITLTTVETHNSSNNNSKITNGNGKRRMNDSYLSHTQNTHINLMLLERNRKSDVHRCVVQTVESAVQRVHRSNRNTPAVPQ